MSDDVTPDHASGLHTGAPEGSPGAPGPFPAPTASGPDYAVPDSVAGPWPAAPPVPPPGSFRSEATLGAGEPSRPVAGYPSYPAEQPTSGAGPYTSWQPTSPAAPMDQYGLGPATEVGFGASEPAANPYARRITPTPPPKRNKLILGLVIGLVAGLLVFGGVGFFVGRGSGGGPTVAGSPSPDPSYVASVKATNQAKFTGELSALAAPWLTDLSGCSADTDPNGPTLGQGEQRHVLCRDGALYVHFVTYSSVDEKNSDRSYRQQLALGTAAILTGSEPPGRKLGGVTAKPGSYVEYATRGAKTPALCGIWWDLDNTSSAVYSDVLCDSLGGTWDPLRAIWRLHS